MKKEYESPEFELVKFEFESILDDIVHSNPEGFSESGVEGPDD